MRNKENKKRLNKKWYDKVRNTQEHKDKKRAWYLAHREDILRERKRLNALKPKRILKTKEEISENKKSWNLANREKRNADARKWRERNLTKQQKYAREYYKTRLTLASQYSRLLAAKKERNKDVLLSFDEFVSIVKKVCAYCGEEKERRGVDRIDNSLGYTKENSNSCCKICNYMKKTMTVKDFLIHVKKIHLHNS